jgi:hypothetical protein
MHFEVDQDRMMVTMILNREAPARARPKRHNLRLPRIDRDFDVVSVQMNNGAAVGRPSEFDSFALLHPNGLHIAGNVPIFDAEIKAAWLGGGLCQTSAGTAKN